MSIHEISKNYRSIQVLQEYSGTTGVSTGIKEIFMKYSRTTGVSRYYSSTQELQEYPGTAGVSRNYRSIQELRKYSLNI